MIEQHLLSQADSLSAIDVAFDSTDGGDRLEATLDAAGASGSRRTATAEASGSRYARLGFGSNGDPPGEYILRLAVPPGGTVTLLHAGDQPARSAVVGSRPVGATVDFRAHYSRDWPALRDDIGKSLRRGALTLCVTFAALAGALAVVALHAHRRGTAAA